MKKVLRKIIKNGVTYWLPEGGGGSGGDIDTNGVNALIDLKLGNYDSLFQMKSGLYKILNAIDEDDELGLESGETRDDIIANASSMSKISHCYAVMCMIVNSEYAFNKVYNSSIAFKEITECWNSITIIAENDDSKNKYLSEEKGVIELLTKEIVQNAFGLGITDILNDSKLFNLISDENFFTYFLEDGTNLRSCVDSTNGKARINNYSADELLPAIYYWTEDYGYTTFQELAEDETAFEEVQNSEECMLIIESNQEAISYINVRYKPNANTKIYIPMDNDLLDHGPNNISVTNNNSVSILNTYDGSKVPVANFSGASRKLTFNNIDNMSGAWTVSVWINLDSRVNQWVFTQGTASTNRGLHLGYSETSRGLTFAMYSNDADVGTQVGADGNRHNLTWTWDGSTGYCIYVDGVLVKSGTLNSGFYSGNNIGYVGDNSFSTGQQFNGKMSDFFIETGKWNADKVFEYVDKSKSFYGLK